jgi:uncharacterized phage-like protein YoqJ
MESGQIALDSSMVEAVRQLQSTYDMQIATLKKLAESQQQIAEMLHAMGVGQNIDVIT